MPALHQTVDDPRMHIFSDRRYIYIWVARRRKVRRRRKRGENGGTWGDAGERLGERGDETTRRPRV